MSPQPITVAICTRNRAESFRHALTSVIASHPFELIVVDQSDDEGTHAVVDEIADPRVRYIHSPVAGLSRAYNTAIAQATTDLIAFTDDDCIVPAEWLAIVREGFAHHPGAALIYGQVIAADIALPRGSTIPELRFTRAELFGPGTKYRVFGMGANFAARREALVAVGGFDEALGGGGIFRSSQDFDLQLRFWRAGLVILADPALVVQHYGLRTGDEGPRTARAYGFGDAAFYLKHARCRDGLAIRLLLTRIAHEVLMPVACFTLRRRYHPYYASGFFQGLRASARHPIDRATRRYVLGA